MLFIKNWNKASLDKSSNSIVTRYKGKINSLTDKTEALRKLLGELYDEAITLNERIKIDKKAIQEDLNDTADDLRTTCGNSSWGQDEIKKVQDLLDRAEEDIEDIKTDIEITTGCLVVCQSGDSGQPSTPCNEGITCNGACFSGDGSNVDDCLLFDDTCSLEDNCILGHECKLEDELFKDEEESEEDCAVIVNGEFDCQGSDSYIDDCYGGCYYNQSCDSQTKVCPKCHGSEIDIIETCTECDTDQKETCGTFDSQDGCDEYNDTGNCYSYNKAGDCVEVNDTGDCITTNLEGSCTLYVLGWCETSNKAEKVDEKEACWLLNKKGTDCVSINTNRNCDSKNAKGDCEKMNASGDCVSFNSSGTCRFSDSDEYCFTSNSIDVRCASENTNGNCDTKNSTGDCGANNKEGNCSRDNNAEDCFYLNKTGNCYSSNDTGNCTRDNINGECTSQTCEAGQLCTTCIEDQKETTTTEKCKAGANIGEEEYCDTCQGTESKVEEWGQEELEDLCDTIFSDGAEVCGTIFAGCFNTENCNGASFGEAIGCGAGEGCGGCDTIDSACDSICDSSESPACGTCDSGVDPCSGGCYGGDCGSCVSGEGEEPPSCSKCDSGCWFCVGSWTCTGCQGDF